MNSFLKATLGCDILGRLAMDRFMELRGPVLGVFQASSTF